MKIFGYRIIKETQFTQLVQTKIAYGRLIAAYDTLTAVYDNLVNSHVRERLELMDRLAKSKRENTGGLLR